MPAFEKDNPCLPTIGSGDLCAGTGFRYQFTNW